MVVQPSSSCRCSSKPVTGNCALQVAAGVELESPLDPPPNGTTAGTARSTDAMERGCPFVWRSPRPSRVFVWGAGSLYSLGGSQVIAIDVVDSADPSGSYGGHTTLGTGALLAEPPEPSDADPPDDEDPSDDVPGAAGTSTHSLGVYSEVACPAVAMMR